MTEDDPLAAVYALARHNLRTPATAVIGYADMLLEDAADQLTPELQSRLTEIAAVGRHTVSVVASLTPAGADVWAEARQRLAGASGRLSAAAARVAAAAAALPDEAEGVKSDTAEIVQAAARFARMLEAGHDQQAATHAAPASAAPLPSITSPGHILIVDDESANRRLMAREVQRFNHTFTMAEDGLNALDQFAGGAFDLIISDLMLPGIGGLELLARVREHPRFGHTPVIVVSARDDVAELVRCLDAGADDLLVKPFVPAVLHARIKACLERKRLRDWELECERHVATLTMVASGIEDGTFDPTALGEVTRRPDALGGLGRVLARSGAAVLAREDELRKQVVELQVEIDQVRRDKQVAAIAETDFMQALVARADELRNLG